MMNFVAHENRKVSPQGANEFQMKHEFLYWA